MGNFEPPEGRHTAPQGAPQSPPVAADPQRAGGSRVGQYDDEYDALLPVTVRIPTLSMRELIYGEGAA